MLSTCSRSATARYYHIRQRIAMNSTPSRLGVPALIGLHLLASAGVGAVFAWKFGHNPRAIAGHVIVLAEWDAALVAIMRALLIVTSGVLPVRTAWHRVT